MNKPSIKVYLLSDEAKMFYIEKLKEEFGTISGGLSTILHERYGSWYNPGLVRILIEGDKNDD